MPLRALAERREILAPSLSCDEWEALRIRTRTGASSLTLPCCGSRAFQRTSPRGLRHFYHSPDSGCEDCGETFDHLAAKTAILQGCELAGYEAHPEWMDDDWRADVLAVRGSIRVAFEVQWSSQTLAETLSRQRRYAEAGVRGCWLFRRPPLGLRRPRWDGSLAARRDLPAFLLPYDPQETPRAYLDGRHYPLDRFIARLLRGDIHFCAQALVPRWQPVALRFYEMHCRRCAGTSHAYSVDPPAPAAVCGIEVLRHRDATSTPFHRAAQRAAWAFLASDEGQNLRVGSIGRRLLRRRERIAFCCFWCDAPFPDDRLFQAQEAAQASGAWTAVHHTLMRTSAAGTVPHPHWCFPQNGTYCH